MELMSATCCDNCATCRHKSHDGINNPVSHLFRSLLRSLRQPRLHLTQSVNQ